MLFVFFYKWGSSAEYLKVLASSSSLKHINDNCKQIINSL